MDQPAIALDRPHLIQVCQRYHIQRLALFGSVLRQSFGSASDVDVLVEFESGRTPDFFTLYDLEQALSSVLGGHPIDLVTYKALNPLLRSTILAQAQVVYTLNAILEKN